MDPKLKEAFDAIHRAFEEFKAANDTRLAEITARGTATAETLQKVDAANAEITALRGQLAELQAAQVSQEKLVARFEALNGATPAGREQLRAHTRQFFAAIKRPLAGEPSEENISAFTAYRAAFWAAVRAPSDRSGTPANDALRAALSIGTDPAGGYLVPPDNSGRVVTLITESSPMRQYADVRTTSRKEVTGRLDLAELGSYWGGEGTAAAETATADIGQWKIPAHDLYLMPKSTQDELDDAEFDVEGWLMRKVANAAAVAEALAFVTGNGITRPRGITTYAAGTPSAAAFGVIQQVNTGAAGAFAAAPAGGDVFFDAVGALKGAYRANARWFLNRLTEAALRKLKDSNGAYHWQPGLQAGIPATLAGYPVALFEDMPAIAANSLSIGFGDLRAAYQIVDRKGITILRDPFTAKPNVVFFTTRRVGGDVVNFEAIKLIKFAA